MTNKIKKISKENLTYSDVIKYNRDQFESMGYVDLRGRLSKWK